MIDLKKLTNYIQSKDCKVFTNVNEYNIVYIEGMNLDGSLNNDQFNLWNDLRIVYSFINNEPKLDFIQVATTEPGKKGTDDSKKGVARIAFGQYNSWKIGFHKQSTNGKNHPALVQCNPVSVFRDVNKDGKRTGDKVDIGIFGINQHSTRPGYIGNTVENWSEGCLVGKNWDDHLKFIQLVKTDSRYVSNNDFIFTTTIIAGDEFDMYTKR